MSISGIKRAHIFCSSLAFYDFEPITDDRAKKWFEYCISIAESIGHPFDEGCCNPGNTKYVLLRNCKRVLEKNLNRIRCIELRTSAKQDIGSYGENWMMVDNKELTSFHGIHRNFITREQMFNMGIKLCKIMHPKYGFFYEIPFVYSPVFYVTGAMGLGELDTYEWSKYYNPKHVDFEERVSSWGQKTSQNYTHDEYDLCSSGHLREIYPINFINENHLNYEIFQKTTLKDWISAKGSRGKLEQVTDELWAWTIEEVDLENVTIELAKSDICLCVNKENPHRYDYGVRPEDQINIENKWHKNSEVEP